jgi:hypothetical protein
LALIPAATLMQAVVQALMTQARRTQDRTDNATSGVEVAPCRDPRESLLVRTARVLRFGRL